jgi:hypothetical protein
MSSKAKIAWGFKAVSLLAVPLAAYVQVCKAQPSSQWTFASADEASRTLFVAVQSHDTGTLREILGQQVELISSGDAAQDELDRDQFLREYRQMHRLAPAGNAEMVLYIGAENWPFPIPLILSDGVWRYDSETGAKEVVHRRIGENEVTAIAACQALVVALKQPKAQAEPADDTLLNAARTAQKPLVSHGYSFRILSSSGNSKREFVAYPVVYGSTGVMTFIVNAAGVVYQKDLGTGTDSIVARMAAHSADSTWIRVEQSW